MSPSPESPQADPACWGLCITTKAVTLYLIAKLSWGRGPGLLSYLKTLLAPHFLQLGETPSEKGASVPSLLPILILLPPLPSQLGRSIFS